MRYCIFCDGELSRVVPSVFVIRSIQKYMPEAMAALCLVCHRQMLVLRKPPYAIIGTVNTTWLSNGNMHQRIFFADGGELIIGKEEPGKSVV